MKKSSITNNQSPINIKRIKQLRVALVHEFLTQYGGAERVLDTFLEIWPEAHIYTLIYDKKKMGQFYDRFNIKTSFLEKLPAPSPAGYKWWLALYPKAIEQFDFSDYDLVLSDSSAFSKGVKVPLSAKHICYMHTPTRYLWSVTKEYLHDAPIPNFIRPLIPPLIKYLRAWDYRAAQRPQYIIANSQNVAKRIEKFYNRKAEEIIFPPVDTVKFHISNGKKKYWLVVARQEPYKRTDLVIKAANILKINLKVCGGGSKADKLKEIAGPTVEFTGRLSDEELANLYSNAKGFIFPQEEDAGITPLEAMASGLPVIAYGKGGALESVIAGTCGEFFPEQTVESLIKVLKDFQPEKYHPEIIRNHAKKFDKEIFKEKIKAFVNNKID